MNNHFRFRLKRGINNSERINYEQNNIQAILPINHKSDSHVFKSTEISLAEFTESRFHNQSSDEVPAKANSCTLVGTVYMKEFFGTAFAVIIISINMISL